MEYEESKKIILNLYEQNIEKYVIPDINNLMLFSSESQEGKCAIPLASTVFSLSDLFGFLLHPQEISSPDKPAIPFFLNRHEFFEKMYSPYKINSDEIVDLIIKIIRNKIAHRFFMPSVEISNDSRLPQRLFLINNNRLLLNVFYFASEVVAVVRKIKEDILVDRFKLKSDKSRDETLMRMANRLSFFENSGKEYEKTVSKIMETGKITLPDNYFNQGSMFKPY